MIKPTKPNPKVDQRSGKMAGIARGESVSKGFLLECDSLVHYLKPVDQIVLFGSEWMNVSDGIVLVFLNGAS